MLRRIWSMLFTKPVPAAIALVPVQLSNFSAFRARQDSRRWEILTDGEIAVVIRIRGEETFPPATLEYVRGVRDYKILYPQFSSGIISHMVRIDLQDGVKACYCVLPDKIEACARSIVGGCMAHP